MSLMPSPAAAERAGYEAALVDVAEQSFFAFAELCPSDEVQEEIEAERAWLRAHMMFESEMRRGTMTVLVPGPLAADLAAAFSGGDAAALHPDLIADLTGELCNMICGLWLTRTCPNDRFRLQPPDVTEVSCPPVGHHWTFARLNGTPVAIEASCESL